MVTMAWQKACLVASLSSIEAFSPPRPLFRSSTRLSSDNGWSSGSQDSNQWGNDDDDGLSSEDWQEALAKKQSGEFWTTFEPSTDDDVKEKSSTKVTEPEDDTEAWLDTLASLGAEEIEFNLKEADRADKVRQMEEWGFDQDAIKSTLDVATDDSLEVQEEVEGMSAYREDIYLAEDDVDLRTVESHTRVDVDEETGDPVRSQMVYVDEHTCIGCYNCACVAQSTFFIDDEHGRARVFQQWGDDDETVQIAIETCPVDCIHYVPYEELVKLEVERRDQNINFKARLVNQGEYGGATSQLVGGANGFTGPQQISGNMGSRCNNCPSAGCKNCPMYGVGENPEFKKKEAKRLEKIERKRLQRERASQNKSADL